LPATTTEVSRRSGFGWKTVNRVSPEVAAMTSESSAATANRPLIVRPAVNRIRSGSLSVTAVTDKPVWRRIALPRSASTIDESMRTTAVAAPARPRTVTDLASTDEPSTVGMRTSSS